MEPNTFVFLFVSIELHDNYLLLGIAVVCDVDEFSKIRRINLFILTAKTEATEKAILYTTFSEKNTAV